MDTKNREIKFRVWDKLNEKMNTNITRLALPHTEHEERLYGTVLMQYTGLKDKNGKEIYEGDILSVVIKGRAKLSIVEWEQPTARYDYEGKYADLNGFIQFGRYKQKYIGKDGGANAMHEGNFEIIGNIYENPELIKN